MDELKRLRSSQRGYRTHLRRLTTRVTEVLEQDNHSSADITGLKDPHEQLQHKKNILIPLDGLVVGLIEGEEELEAEVCEAEDIQALISENISQINGFLESRERQSPAQSIVTVEAVVQTQGKRSQRLPSYNQIISPTLHHQSVFFQSVIMKTLQAVKPTMPCLTQEVVKASPASPN